MRISRRNLLKAAAATGVLPAAWARAQSFPSKPVRVVVPFGPGGATDVAVRIVAEKLSDRFGQRFVVENLPGAGGIPVARAVIAGGPDGHTLGVATNGTAVSVSQFKALPYDPVRDFDMISTVSLFEAVFAVPAESPYRTLADFIKAAKAAPGKINVGTVTAGGSQHLAAELFKVDAGVDFQIVTFKTSPEILVSLLRNDIQMTIEFYTALRGHLADRRVHALATSSARRSATLPEVPTVAESGVPGYEVTSWNAIFGAKGTPPEVIRALNQGIQEVVAMPDVKRRLGELGLEARASTPEELSARLRADIAKWAKVIERAGIPKQ